VSKLLVLILNLEETTLSMVVEDSTDIVVVAEVKVKMGEEREGRKRGLSRRVLEVVRQVKGFG
jgi:hypothetical protein